MKNLLKLIALFGFLAATAQSPYPQTYFDSPLNIPLLLSGSFGELRSNHFHTGLDFKTQQKEGLPILACAEGYVSRIKISPYGYGKAIYIDHPNGYTTVYGHLQQFTGEIAEYVRNAQYKEQSFEIELFPKKEELPIQRGQTIALSGNSGSSAGPHLHFEIRETVSELSVNPMFFGFDKRIADSKRPQIHSVLVYPIGDDSFVNQSQFPLAINLALQPNGNYLADPIVARGSIGFSLSTTDGFDNTYHKNGPFSIESCVNGNRVFAFTADKLAFNEGRFINAYLDYKRLKSSGIRYQKLFMNRAFALRNLFSDQQLGKIIVAPNLNEIYKIEVADFAGNKTIVEIPISYDGRQLIAEPKPKDKPISLKCDIENLYEEGNYAVSVKPLTFYDDVPLIFKVQNDELEFGSDDFPIHQNITISYDASAIPEEQQAKTFIASVDGTKLKYNSTKLQNGRLITYTKNLGKFKIASDTIPPKIKPYNISEGKWLTKQQTIIFTVTDLNSGISKYNGYINDKWVLFEYDPKDKSLTYLLNNNELVDGKNQLKLSVTDDLGNSAIFETFFYRKIN
jgi:murein DD-endopeptidase MepM/ murein hydrolase activator NlpD